MSNLKQIRHIDPNSEANDGPAETTLTSSELARHAANRAERLAAMNRVKTEREAGIPFDVTSRAIEKARAASTQASAAWSDLTAEQKREQEPDAGREIHAKRDAEPSYAAVKLSHTQLDREAQQRYLAKAIDAIRFAVTLGADEHALLSIIAEIKNLAA